MAGGRSRPQLKDDTLEFSNKRCTTVGALLLLLPLFMLISGAIALFFIAYSNAATDDDFGGSSSLYRTVTTGSKYSKHFGVFFVDKNLAPISPWHDIPLFADKENSIYNMVVEIPRWSQAKFEMQTRELMNPIRQDIKNNRVRFVPNIYPHHGYMWNYGALPQTWEDSTKRAQQTNAIGDNDPIDIVEIGAKVRNTGDVIQVKILGVIALIDGGETDWKLVSIDVTDPMAEKLNDINDVETYYPGLLDASRDFLRDYKLPQGGTPNTFGYGGQFLNRAFSHQIIAETNEQWKQLLDEDRPPRDLIADCHQPETKHPADNAEWRKKLKEAPRPSLAATLPADVDYWYYLGRRNARF